jgi:hypothetical protein
VSDGRLQPRKIRQSLAQQDQLIAFAQRSRFTANRVEHHCFTAIAPDASRSFIRELLQPVDADYDEARECITV